MAAIAAIIDKTIWNMDLGSPGVGRDRQARWASLAHPMGFARLQLAARSLRSLRKPFGAPRPRGAREARKAAQNSPPHAVTTADATVRLRSPGLPRAGPPYGLRSPSARCAKLAFDLRPVSSGPPAPSAAR